MVTIQSYMLTGSRRTGGGSQNFEPGGVGFGAQPGGVWVKVLPCDTHRGAAKILEGGVKIFLRPPKAAKFLFFFAEKK